MNNSGTPTGEKGKHTQEMKVTSVSQKDMDKLFEFWENYEEECCQENKYQSLDCMTFDVPLVSVKTINTDKQEESIGLNEIQHVDGKNRELIVNPNEVTSFKGHNIEKEPEKKNAFKRGNEKAKEDGVKRREEANAKIENEKKSAGGTEKPNESMDR